MKKFIVILIAIAEIGVGVAIGDGIDPGVLVKSGGKYGVDESLNTEPRPGVNVDEINLMSIDSTVTASIADKMNVALPVQVGEGLYNGTWVSLTNLFTTVGITDQPTKDAFTKWFVNVDANPDAEEYWGDTNNNNAIESPNEWYHRFNLTRTDWDTMTMANINTNLFAAPVTYSVGTGSHNGGGLRWLANFGKNASGADDSSLKGNFPTVTARRNQIAANLIDYCDTNSNPTTDYAEAAGAASVTYMGNERTPRINEVYIGVHAVAARANRSGSNYATRLVIYSVVGGELINIYGNNFGAATLRVSYSVTATITGTAAGMPAFGTKTYKLATAPNSTSINLGGSNGYVSGKTETSIYDSTSTNKTGSPYPTAGVTAVTVTITEAKLTRNSDGVVIDYAKFNYTSPSATIKVATGPGAAGWEQTTFYGCFQADDPRQHLFPSEWSAGTTDPVAGTSPAYGAGGGTKGTPGAVNNNVTMSTSGKDPENGKVVAADAAINDPSYKFTGTVGPRLSTAYIRNGPIVSPWELGAIHRGAAWETINLKEYNAVAGANPLTGGGLYTAAPVASKNGGDANILDQIKMTPRVENKQKVNLCIKSDDTTTVASSGVLSALFKKIHIGSKYENNVRLLGMKNNTGQLPTSGNVIGDRWILNSGAVYTWNGASWVSATLYPGDGYAWNDTDVTFWDGTAWPIWTNLGTEISIADVKAIVNDIKARSSAFKTRACVVAQASTLIDRTGQTTDRTKEEIIGKTINLTTVAPTGYFTIIIIAQSIKDVGPGTFSKDLDMNGTISTASEVTLGADINGDGDMVDTGIPETITKTAFGSYMQYADEIMAEQKIRVDVYRNPATGKYTIIRMQYLEE